MKKLTYILSLLLIFALAGCGGDDTADNQQSPEAQEMTEQVGGPFTADEFEKFLVDLPSIKGLTAHAGDGMISGAALSAKIKSEVKGLGWNEDRFMYIFSHAISVANVDQMEDMSAQMTQQMAGMPEAQKKMMEQAMAEQMGGQMDALKAEVDKQVPASEQVIIRDNLDDLYKAMGLK